jgi:UDP-N-acetyl-D-mannosaminuronic acid dehydrogenase
VHMYNLTLKALERVNKTIAGSKVAILGWAFISNSDDARNPPSEPFRNLLIDSGCKVDVHDPHVQEYPGVPISQELSEVVKNADVTAIFTGHDEYFNINASIIKGLMDKKHPVIIDGRNVIDPDEFINNGFVYKGIGRGDKNNHIINA